MGMNKMGMDKLGINKMGSSSISFSSDPQLPRWFFSTRPMWTAVVVSTRLQWQKIRGPLNHLVENTWVVFADKIIECEDYQEMYRASLDQVITDLSRLVEHNADSKCVDTECRQIYLDVFQFNPTFTMLICRSALAAPDQWEHLRREVFSGVGRTQQEPALMDAEIRGRDQRRACLLPQESSSTRTLATRRRISRKLEDVS